MHRAGHMRVIAPWCKRAAHSRCTVVTNGQGHKLIALRVWLPQKTVTDSSYTLYHTIDSGWGYLYFVEIL